MAEAKSYQKITAEKRRVKNKARYDKMIEEMFDSEKHEICPTTMEEVFCSLGISNACFYDYYPIDSNDFNDIKDKLQESKANIKRKLKDKWLKSDNATTNIALFKLCSNEEERRILADKLELSGDKVNPVAIALIPATMTPEEWEENNQ